MLAIIPARGGSKGIKGKNTVGLCGKPLIYYTIKSAQASKFIDKIIVSTDDRRIAYFARKYNAAVPFLRPHKLALDNTSMYDSIVYALSQLNRLGRKKIDEFILLQPTSPLRSAKDIDAAVSIFFRKKADAVISVTMNNHPPTLIKKINNKGALENYFQAQSVKNSNRQNFVKSYTINGAVYVFKSEYFKNCRGYYNGKVFPYLMPKARSLDIDDIFDLELARLLIKSNQRGE